MIPVLAQLSLDQVHPLVQFIVGGSAAVFLLNQLITFWKEHVREKPIPSETYATLAVVKDLDRQAHGRMNRERDAAAAATAAAEARMQADVARIETAVAGYNTNAEARSNAINGRLDDLSDKISDAPEKVVEMLARTKGLIG